jgi:hypothetical protein
MVHVSIENAYGAVKEAKKWKKIKNRRRCCEVRSTRGPQTMGVEKKRV